MKTMIKLTAAFALLAAACFGQQYTLASTTLGAAVTSTSTTSITLASTSTMLNQGGANQVNTCLYVDTEVMAVITVVDSTHVTVARRGGGCGAVGLSSRPTTHANGAKVYFAITQTIGGTVIPAPTLIGRNTNALAEDFGSCTQSNELVLPKIYLFTGDIMDCKNSGSGGQWIKVGFGTMAPAGTRFSNFCTGSLGSAETEYLNGAACSGATTATARLIVNSPGTLANLYSVAGTNVSGGTNKDVLTVYKNGSATTLTCTYATGGAATTCSDTSHSVAVVPGDVITFQFVTATSDTGANVAASVGEY